VEAGFLIRVFSVRADDAAAGDIVSVNQHDAPGMRQLGEQIMRNRQVRGQQDISDFRMLNSLKAFR
jgi:hypothetical protein